MRVLYGIVVTCFLAGLALYLGGCVGYVATGYDYPAYYNPYPVEHRIYIMPRAYPHSYAGDWYGRHRRH